MISFTEDTAPTADEAMRLNEEIIRPFAKEHLVMSVVHNEKRDSSLFHVHNYVSTTNYNDGSMLYSDNRTNYGIAQRVADVTGKETALSVTYEQGKEGECPEIFTSQDEESNILEGKGDTYGKEYRHYQKEVRDHRLR